VQITLLANFQMLVFLPNKIFKIPTSHIEIELVFNLVGVLITLKCYYVYVKNMDQIIMVIQNYPNDVLLNRKLNANLNTYMKAKNSLVEKTYHFIEAFLF
jgi:hypothetical protein